MNNKMSRKIKNLLIKYVKEYASRILSSNNKTSILNMFDGESAAQAAKAALLKNNDLTTRDIEWIQSEEGYERIIKFFKEKLVVNYFMLSRQISYYEAKSLLTDKGTMFFPETKEIIQPLYVGRYKDYKATDKQISYIKSFDIEIKHSDELTGREASLIISCLKTPNKTKPAYFTYYIKNP